MAVVTFTLNLPVEFEKDGKWVIARFPHLDVVSQGRTQAEAQRNLIEAAQLFIESCYERNVLDEALKSLGFTPAEALGRRSKKSDYLTVPFELLAAARDPQAHAC